MDFCGNHALTDDPRVPLARSWLGNGCKGCTNNAATEAARGSQARDWPLADIVRRGYALAAFYSGDVDPDRTEVSEGLYAWLANGDPAKNNPTNRGTIAAWAWGFQRCVDYLVTETALWTRTASPRWATRAMARRPCSQRPSTSASPWPSRTRRVAAVPRRAAARPANRLRPSMTTSRTGSTRSSSSSTTHPSGCRSTRIAWSPFARHGRCSSPAATGDQWANPAGQFQVLQAADPVYRFLGTEGLAAKEMPPLRKLVASRLGYYLREGKHSMTPE